MLQLRRVRLESIGHPNARFAPLELDLVDEDGRPTHTVVWLRNGGGKSSLLNLLFAVVRPHRREFLGGNDDGKDRRLADYVLAGDTGHVCLEWGRPADRRPSLVTGMALEWRDRTPVDDESRLRRLWYAFVPSDHREPGLLAIEPTLTFDTVPHSVDGRRLSLARFRDRLRALGASDTSLRLVTPGSQTEWRRELEQHDLDPEVLRYQLQMNREEGGASELFKRRCRTPSDFVDLLLELAVADERTDRVADVYTRYADELARRPDVERNRDFVAGVLERLDPLVDLDVRRTSTDRELRGVLSDAAATAGALRDRGSEIRGAAETDLARSSAARRAAEEADAEEARLRRRHASLQRLAARLAVDAAHAHHDEATAALRAAEDRLAAARLLEPLARRRAIETEIAALEARMDGDPSDARVQLHRTRLALATRLRADATTSAEAAEAQRRAAAARQEEAEASAAVVEAVTAERGRLEQALATMHERRDAWIAQRDGLRQRGVLAADEDVALGLERALSELDDARRRRGQHRARAAALDEEVRSAYARQALLDEAAGDAHARRSSAAHELAQMQGAAATLTGDQRLCALAETAAIDIWSVGAGLADRLDALVADADRALADAAVGEAGDRAALVALQTDGLLPPRGAVTEVVALLDAHGVGAQPGWRYLAQHVAEANRGAVIAHAPEVADGVVVTDPEDIDRAAEALAGIAEPLRSVVVLAPPPRIGDTGHGSTVAPVDPALFDRSHADRATVRLRARLAGADRERARLIGARDRDAALADRLRRLLREYPQARRDQIVERDARARAEHTRLRAERDNAARQVERAEERRVRLGEEGHDPEELTRLSGVVSELRALDAARIEEHDIASLTADIDLARDRAEAAAARVEEHRAAAADHRVAAQRYADDRVRLDDELAALGVAPTDDATEVETDVATDELRRRLRLMDTAGQGSDDVLLERRRLLFEQRAEHERLLSRAPATAVAEAEDLLTSADGRDGATRAAALERVLADRDAALERRAEAGERLRAARDAARPADDTDDVGDADGDITTAEDARRRAAEAVLAADRLRDEASSARATAAAADRRAAGAGQRADAFDHLAELLTIELRARPTSADDDERPGAVVPDEPDAARTLVDDLHTRIADHADRLDRAARAVASAAADVRRFVGDDRFAALDGPIRGRLAADPVAVARDGGALVDELRIRLAQCEQTLEELTAHRRLLVREIAADTQRGLWLLRQADQVSALPAGFGDWSDERFLQIRFATPAVDEELMTRLEAMVDDLVDAGVRPAGVPLLQRAVHAAVGPQGFVVRILKPNPALIPQRVPVTELATFSGGEQLTAAILLYCTLARLRAQARQVQTAAGVLTLDNPIGKSSNVTLLQLQRRVADAMGVQLVYTTAVDDREAVGVLPHWIRLRNERRDTRTGNLHVERTDDDTAAHGVVAATHLWRRTDAVGAGPGGR
jgi:hypothetical protein